MYMYEDLKDQMSYVAQHLETSALEFFSSHGWLAQRHLGFV